MTDIIAAPGATVYPPDPPSSSTFLLGSAYGNDGVGGDWYDWDDELRNHPENPSGKGLALVRDFSPSTSAPTTYVGTEIEPYWTYNSDIAVVWSRKMAPSAVIAGTHDSALTNFFNSIPAGRRLFFTNFHEPYDNWQNGEFTQAQFRAHIAHMVDLLDASSADRDLVKVGVVLTSTDFRDPRDPNVWFPTVAGEGTKCDFVGVDPYAFYRPPGWDGGTTKLYNYRNSAYMFGPSLDFAAQYGKPWIACEHAMHPDPLYPTGDGTNNTNDPGIPARDWRFADALSYINDHPAEAVGLVMWEASAGSQGPWWMSAFHDYNDPTDRTDKDPYTLSVIVGALQDYGIFMQGDGFGNQAFATSAFGGT